jgi:epoxide hydrolase-like predicted phosphatase
MTIRAVIFDIGDVLLRMENHDKRHEWEARLGLSREDLTHLVFGSKVAARAVTGEVPEEAIWKYVAETLRLSDEQLPQFQRDFWEGDQFDADLAQFMQTLRPRYKVGIISNAWSNARSAINRRFNLDSYVDDAIYSAEVKLAKPDVRIFRLALERLGVQAEEAVFVDDVLENVQAAQSLGMKGVQFKNTQQTIKEVIGYLDDYCPPALA